jgi:TusA-related sulfurtransferase
MAKKLKPAKIVDVRGTICPGSLWEMLIAYKDAKIGDIIAVYSSDPEIKNDAPEWIEKSKNEFVGVYDRDGYYEVLMRKSN